MADWSNLPDVTPDDAALATWANAVRDNPVAIAEGAAGAPRVLSNTAINWNGFGVGANAARDYTLARMATLSAGAVGSVAFLCTDQRLNLSPGSTRAGSALFYACATVTIEDAPSIGGTTSPAGTWRLLGQITDPGKVNRSASMWLRIS